MILDRNCNGGVTLNAIALKLDEVEASMAAPQGTAQDIAVVTDYMRARPDTSAPAADAGRFARRADCTRSLARRRCVDVTSRAGC